jgi:hypothetical protein
MAAAARIGVVISYKRQCPRRQPEILFERINRDSEDLQDNALLPIGPG